MLQKAVGWWDQMRRWCSSMQPPTLPSPCPPWGSTWKTEGLRPPKARWRSSLRLVLLTHTHTHNTAVYSPLLILFISWVHSAAKCIYSTPVRRRVVCDSVWQFCDSDTVWMTAVTLLLMNEYLREWPSTCVMTEWDLLSHSHALGPERHCDKVWLEMET